MTTDTTPARGSDAEPTDQEVREVADALGIAIPPRPPLPLVRRSRYDDLADDLAAALVALAKARAAHDVATERTQDEPDPQPPAGTPHHTYSAAEFAQHLEDECEDCVATLPDQSDIFLVTVAHAARDASQAAALLLLLQDLDGRNLLKKPTGHC
ncbi:hypothetical protein [Streptomyces chumphonensis]|uniref:hypothetical protein n=1 Tax=Streptomyces chumphonensis TaxID=1214925 RepID=UPI003D759525